MSLSLFALIALAVLAVGYVTYGGLVARWIGLDAARATPATTVNDGVDYVPAKPFYLMGQHFSAIAAAGPIAGPILACQQFGWLPCLLWIGLGVVFIGAVHDFSALVASMRHGAKSIAEVVRENIGPRAWLAILLFIWLALIYVITAFAGITADTFVGKSQEIEFGKVTFDPGGAVAAASILYLGLAVVMGLLQRFTKLPLWLLTLVFVPATFGAVWLGTKLSTHFILDYKTWGLLILAYCAVASLVPVWSLLQPRGYLGGFVLYAALAIGVVGIFSGKYAIQQPEFKGWETPTGIPLVPMLFVTIACGACSGFHGLVCSGTTSKQISSEAHCRPIGYGGMLLEGFVAIIALATVMIVASPKGGPGSIYSAGLGDFLTTIIGPEHKKFAVTFAGMAFSTFVFDTLDVSTRLGRYIVQELFRWKTMILGGLATLLTLTVPAIFIWKAARKDAYMDYWTLFGASNQLLAALTLMGVSVWLHRSKRPSWFTVVPMIFVMTITVWALGRIVALNPRTLNGAVAVILILLAAGLLLDSARAVRRAVA